MARFEAWTFCCLKNGVVLELHKIVASQNCHSCQYEEKRTEGGYYDESNVSSSRDDLVAKLCYNQ